MPHSFRAQIWKMIIDHDQETVVTLKVPECDGDAVAPLRKLTKKVVIVTVFEEREVQEGARHV